MQKHQFYFICLILVLIVSISVISCGKQEIKQETGENTKENSSEDISENKQQTVKISGEDCFTVIKIKGEIICNDKPLKENDKICGKDNLVLKSLDAVAILHSTEKGRFTLKRDAKESKSELAGVLSSIISSSGSGSLSSRGAVTREEEFKGNYYIISGCDIEIDLKKYPLDNSRYFYLKFKYNNEDINKKLNNTEKGFTIVKKDVLSIDNKPLNIENIQDCQLYYYDEAGKTSKIISTFNLHFLDDLAVKNELTEHFKKIGTLNEEEKFKESLIYVNTIYGNINNDCLKNWIKNNL